MDDLIISTWTTQAVDLRTHLPVRGLSVVGDRSIAQLRLVDQVLLHVREVVVAIRPGGGVVESIHLHGMGKHAHS